MSHLPSKITVIEVYCQSLKTQISNKLPPGAKTQPGACKGSVKATAHPASSRCPRHRVFASTLLQMNGLSGKSALAPHTVLRLVLGQ